MGCTPQQKKKRWKDELALIKERLALYYAAERAILGGAQEYRIGTRQLRRGDLQYIQREIDRLRNDKDELENALSNCTGPNQRKSYRIVYRDL